jgi:hypothetical protein
LTDAPAGKEVESTTNSVFASAKLLKDDGPLNNHDKT